ncbi:MAG: tryptophan synthase subunit alpha [Pseudomonadota bacterium]
MSTPGERLSSAIRSTREKRVALVAFMTAGFPTRQQFRADLRVIAAHADVVEIGVPFTDPMADGVTIQRSSLAALKQGVSLHWILDELAAIPPMATPLVLMSYLNPLLAFGLPQLAARAAAVGVTGFIVPDLPLEESADFQAALDVHGIALIRMVTPVTPPARLEKLCRNSRGFVYAVTMTGTTGKTMSPTTGTGASGGLAGAGLAGEVTDYLDRVRALSPVPVCAGFGIREAAQVGLLAPHVDGVIVGSALVEALERGASPAALLDSLRGGAA